MSEKCAIWGSRTLRGHQVPNRDAEFYNSPRAGGAYIITRTAKINLRRLTDKQRAFLTTWLIEQRQAGNESPNITSSEVELAEGGISRKLTERRDGLLKAIVHHSPELGQSMQYYDKMGMAVDGEAGNSFWAAKDFLLAATESIHMDEVNTLIDFANQQGFLTKGSGKVTLTFHGYTHLEELETTKSDSLQAFVAMWFGAEVSEAYNHGIAPAIIDAGYRPMRIDQKEHNNKIDDEIIAEIRRSKFLVADFTCGLVEANGTQTAIPRGGVYYEAGFAQGLGIPVIWCCREDHINHVHFDTRQFNHITWSSPQELREKLRNRIGAVIGDGPGAA